MSESSGEHERTAYTRLSRMSIQEIK